MVRGRSGDCRSGCGKKEDCYVDWEKEKKARSVR